MCCLRPCCDSSSNSEDDLLFRSKCCTLSHWLEHSIDALNVYRLQVCEACDLCELSTHFRKAQCTTIQQTDCQALTVCGSEQFQTRAPSLTQDRLCQDATQCVAGQEEVNKLTATSDRSCQTCPAGKTDADSNPSTPCVACGAGHYVPQGSTGSCQSLQCAAGFTDADSDSTTACVQCNGITTYNPAPARAGDCLAMTVCSAGQEVTTTGSSTANRGCQACTSGAYSITSNSVGGCLFFCTTQILNRSCCFLEMHCV